MTLPRRWPEHELIEKQYARRGRHWLARKTGKTPAAVHAYATRHGLQIGDTPNHIRIPDLARLLDVDTSNLWQRANKDGALIRYRAATRHRATFAAVVSIEWADAFAAELATQRAAAERATREEWLTTLQIAKTLGVGKSTVLRALEGKPGVLSSLPEFQAARTLRGLGPSRDGQWFMHPDDAAVIAARLEADRQLARTLVATKTIAVECGVKQSYTADLGRRAGGRLLFVHGRLMCHVTPEVAAELRARFTASKGEPHA